MKVIVDTCIWSLALRRNQPKSNINISKLESLINDSRVQLLGPIRQELLSGILSHSQFLKLKERLSVFPDFPLTTEYYELAAEFFNKCRAKGIQGSTVDFLICAVASKLKFPIFTEDHDFVLYTRYLPIELY